MDSVHLTVAFFKIETFLECLAHINVYIGSFTVVCAGNALPQLVMHTLIKDESFPILRDI